MVKFIGNKKNGVDVPLGLTHIIMVLHNNIKQHRTVKILTFGWISDNCDTATYRSNSCV